MASLWRRERSPFWFACYTDALGRRIKKSTKIRVHPLKGSGKTAGQLRQEASDLCSQWAKLAEKGRGRTLSEAQARRVVAEIFEQSTGESLHFHSLKAWMETWLQTKEGTVAKSTLVKYRQIIDDFLNLLGSKVDLPLGVISPTDVVGFQRWMNERKLAPSTINVAIKKMLNAPFLEAHKLGYIPVNPVAAVKRLKETVEGKRECFTENQIAALLAESKGTDWEGAILCGLTTTDRLGDVCGLEWQMLDLEKRLLKRATQKTGFEKDTPLHPAFCAWLDNRSKGRGSDPVFPHLHPQKFKSGANGPSHSFKKLMKKAGVYGRPIRKKIGDGRSTSSLSFHSLRHSGNSLMANAGVSEELRMKITGHKSKVTHAVYTHHEIEIRRKAVESMHVPSAKKLKKKREVDP